MAITENQIGLIKHALGLNLRKEPDRNYFVADSGHAAFKDLEELVVAGMMTKRPSLLLDEKSMVYNVTAEGKKAVGVNP